MTINVNDTVRLLSAIPEERLPQGAVGVVLAHFNDPDEAYEIEFSGLDGSTAAQLTLKPNQFVIIS